ncbi:MAG: DUF1192 domain-containing protein [Hyphomicrobiaceae bacterium]
MDWDELRPKSKSVAIAIGEDLAGHSIAELDHRIAALKAEIERVEVELHKKRAHEAAASALFKS